MPTLFDLAEELARDRTAEASGDPEDRDLHWNGDIARYNPARDPALTNSFTALFSNPAYWGSHQSEVLKYPLAFPDSSLARGPLPLPISCCWNHRDQDELSGELIVPLAGPLIVVKHGHCAHPEDTLRFRSILPCLMQTVFTFEGEEGLPARTFEARSWEDVLSDETFSVPVPPPLRNAIALYIRDDPEHALTRYLLNRAHFDLGRFLSFSVYPNPGPSSFATPWKIFVILGQDLLHGQPSFNEVVRIRDAVLTEFLQRLRNDDHFRDCALRLMAAHQLPDLELITIEQFLRTIHIQPVELGDRDDNGPFGLLLLALPFTIVMHSFLVLLMKRAICGGRTSTTQVDGVEMTLYEDNSPHPIIHCCACGSDLHLQSHCPLTTAPSWSGFRPPAQGMPNAVSYHGPVEDMVTAHECWANLFLPDFLRN
ncbi:uncharacterized protein BXZ73DRAFT_106785 [Epithele typhae]|uniref:uncharacterized protein n=1 Tax=Epithele typhae TaxID=378194 RepID=UPI002008A859|nr:uncharacterized protein BXZ73DRAFT_106785 [Epithele typhae]KAH9913881.1 hypothetical protein BXZ73DRAFT_106785 [Epithele typhae]